MPVYIDVVGRCNLKCPSCPEGNSLDRTSVGGSMSPELLSNILRKVAQEKPDVDFVGLYNWTEPLLHPKIGELIQIVKSFGFPCYVSTNLNLSKRLEDVVQAAPDFLRISVSGFTNAVYQKQHSGGDVEVVKQNMLLLADLLKKHGSKTHVQVYYLRWIGNLDDEILMQRYSESLGFSFQTHWAWLSPVEKILAILSGDPSVTETDLMTAASLAAPFDKTLEVLAEHASFEPCQYANDYIVLDCAGRVSLCCGVYDQRLYTVGNYLDHSWPDFIKMKEENAGCRKICQQCMGLGLPAMGNLPEVNGLAVVNILNRYASRLGVSLS